MPSVRPLKMVMAQVTEVTTTRPVVPADFDLPPVLRITINRVEPQKGRNLFTTQLIQQFWVRMA